MLASFAKEDFLTFCQLMPTERPYTVAWFHEIIAQELQNALQKVQNGEKARIIISVPPRHGKSLTVSQLFPAWALGKYPDLRFILTTYGAELSEKMGLGTRDIIQSEQYSAIFPKTNLRQDVKSKRKWMTETGGSYTAVGIGGSVTGIGADIILIDDPHKDRKEAESNLQRDRVWEYYKSTLYSRLQGSGAIILIMQRWHTDDLVGRLMEQQENNPESDQWTVINFPAVAEEDEYYDGALVRKQGEPLWEKAFPLEKLSNIRQNSGTYNWISQYQQDPVLQEEQEFQPHYFRTYEEKDLAPLRLRYYTLVDPAISQRKEADESVVLTVAKEIDGPNIYRIHEDAGHFTPKQLIDIIFKHHEQYDSNVTLEQIAFQKALKYSIEEEQRRREVYFAIHETKVGNKEERIRGLLPLYQRGVIHHRHNEYEYEKQLMQFPRGKRDDRADCMSFCLDTLKPTRKKGTKVFYQKITGYFNPR